MASPTDALWEQLRPGPKGLVPAIVQHADNGQVLMLGYMNREALAATITHQRVTFWSRSRDELWEKGATSGNTLDLVDLATDCDQDALVVLARPHGPTCHTGKPSCFFRPRKPGRGQDPDGWGEKPEGLGPLGSSVGTTLQTVFATIMERKLGRGLTSATGQSYVQRLLTKGAAKIGEKLREEADELAVALADETDERVDSEAGDLLFHMLVGLALRDRSPADVAAVLDKRHGISGIDEKAKRQPSS